MKNSLTALMFALAAPAWANATVLDFSGNACASDQLGLGIQIACSNGTRINQSYGDSLNVDVTWAVGGTQIGSMVYWEAGYSGLTGVGYGDIPEIRIEATSGSQITLTSFLLGAYPDLNRQSRYTVRDLATGAVVAEEAAITVLGSAPYLVSVGRTSSAGFQITFGPDGYNVGIDNITFETSPVPEPSTMLLMGIGIATVIIKRRSI
jgi:hypothetical protein